MKKFIILILVLIMTLSMASCSKKVEKEQFKAYFFDWFDTATVITGYEETKDDFDKVVKEIETIFAKYHKLYDIYTKYDGVNNLAVINDKSSGIHSTVKVEPEIIDLLELSFEMNRLTNGKFNIAMGSVLSIWHTYRELGMAEPENAELPPIEDLKDAYLHSDINDIKIDKENQTVFLADDRMTLDVGAIAKGYACEQAAKHLEQMGVTGYVINAGGNIRSIGTKPNDEPWVVGIENPDTSDEENPYIAYLELNGQALVTSGNYQRYYTVNGKNYHHIIDPETLMPSERYLSVSVLSYDSGMADALSTALFNMTQEEGLEIIKGLKDVEAQWVLPSGEIVRSDGFQNYISE